MDFDTLRSKYPGYSDDEILGAFQATKYPDYSVDELKNVLGWKPVKRSTFAAVNDTVIEGANAVAGGVKAVGDFIAPGNRVSSFIDENIIKDGEAKQSDEVKAEKARLAREVQEADGIGGEIGATLGYVVRNPGLAGAQAFGSFVVPGAAIKGVRLAGGGARAALGGGVLAGAALSGGDAAGQAYEQAIKAGATEEQAQEAARQASIIPAAVGGLGGAFGAERVFAGAKGYAGGAAARALKTGASEAAQEAVEEGVTQYEAQRAVMPYDPSIDPMKGVASAATMGAALGGITGAGVGALSKQDGAEKVREAAEPVPDILSAPDLDTTLVAAAEGLFGDGKTAREQREADRPPEPAGETQPGDILNGDGSPFQTMPAAMRALQEAGSGHELVRVADGLVVRAAAAPAAIEAPPTGDDALPVLPGGRTMERTLGNIALDADRARAEAQKAADLERMPADATEQNVQQAAVQRAATLEGESPLAAALRKAREASIPQGVTSSPAPAPAAEEAKTSPPEPRIVERLPDMRPMSKLGAEQQAAKIPGAEVVRIPNRQPGKFAYTVIAPEARGNDAQRDGGTATADPGRGDRAVGVPEQRPSDVRISTAVAAGQGGSSVQPAGVPRADAERPAGALTVGATFEQAGRTWTVTEANGRMVRAQDGQGSTRTVAAGSKTWDAIVAQQSNAAAPGQSPAHVEVSSGAPSAPVAAAPDAIAETVRSLDAGVGTRIDKLRARRADAENRLASADGLINPRDRAEEVARQQRLIVALDAAEGAAQAADEADERAGMQRAMLKGARQELDAAVRSGAVSLDEAKSIATRAGATGNAADATDAVFAGVDGASAPKRITTTRSADEVASKDTGGAPGRALDQGGSPADSSLRARVDRASIRNPELVALRKRAAILKSILECLGT